MPPQRPLSDDTTMKSLLGVGLSEGVLAKTSGNAIIQDKCATKGHGHATAKRTRVGDTVLLASLHSPLSLCELGRSNHFHRLSILFRRVFYEKLNAK